MNLSLLADWMMVKKARLKKKCFLHTTEEIWFEYINAVIFEIKRVNACDFWQCARFTVNRRSNYHGQIHIDVLPIEMQAKQQCSVFLIKLSALMHRSL